MKRVTLILVAILCLATTALNAQTHVGDLENGYFSSIPAAFTNNGHSYVVFDFSNDNHTYNFSIYQSDFTTHVIGINNVMVLGGYIDYDNLRDYNLLFTQNLFNTDDSFEYIEAEGVFDPTYYEWMSTALHVKSTDGNTLWSFNAEEGYNCSGYLFKLDNKYYLLVNEYKVYEEHRYHLYFISQSQGLTEVKTELPISVFPSIANRGQQITVELGEGNNATEVTVINGLGQVIKRMPVQKGQRQVIIPAQDLNSGLNVVNTRTQQGQGSCKIIVR